MPDGATDTSPLIHVESALPRIDLNYEEAKARLQKELEPYDIVVTHDTVADAKKLATELNKRAGEIDRIRKDKIAEVSAPIREADGRMKELVSLCKDGRQKLLTQVERYEAETREEVGRMLADELDRQYEAQELRDEYQTVQVGDLAKVTNMTPGGKLTKPAATAVADRAREKRSLQDKVDLRLARLEADCYRAGLAAPLGRDHVEHFLYAPDEEYAQRLESLMAAEVKREQEADRRRQAQAERAPEPALPAAEQPPAQAAPEPAEAPPMEQPAPGRVAWRVTALFDVSAPDRVDQEAIENKLRKMLADAGITDSLVSVEARRA